MVFSQNVYALIWAKCNARSIYFFRKLWPTQIQMIRITLPLSGRYHLDLLTMWSSCRYPVQIAHLVTGRNAYSDLSVHFTKKEYINFYVQSNFYVVFFFSVLNNVFMTKIGSLFIFTYGYDFHQIFVILDWSKNFKIKLLYFL